MGRNSPSWSPARRSYGGRERSPFRGNRHGGYLGRREPNTSLLIRNLPRDCKPEDLRQPFERYGEIQDIYLPRDYHTGQPRGFGFVQYTDPSYAENAQYHMDGADFGGRQLVVVFAKDNRKKPEEMRVLTRRRPERYNPYARPRPRSHGRRRSRSYSRSPVRSRGRETLYRSPNRSVDRAWRGDSSVDKIRHYSVSRSPSPQGWKRSESPEASRRGRF